MRKFLLIGSCLIYLVGCYQESSIKLQDNKDETIVYYASREVYRIEISKGSDIQRTNYIIQINGLGVVMGVYKYPAVLDNEKGITDNFHRQTQYLTTDTTDTLIGAKFFYYSIIGYYHRHTNFIINNHFQGTITLLSEQEELMFARIDSLMKRHKLNYRPFNVLQTFWFKYDVG